MRTRLRNLPSGNHHEGRRQPLPRRAYCAPRSYGGDEPPVQKGCVPPAGSRRDRHARERDEAGTPLSYGLASTQLPPGAAIPVEERLEALAEAGRLQLPEVAAEEEEVDADKPDGDQRRQALRLALHR